MSSNGVTCEQVSSEELAAYLDGELTADEKRRILDHLGTCSACRAEVVQLTTMLSAGPRRRSWKMAALPLGVAAAAVLLLVVLPTSEVSAPGDAIRGPETAAEREGVIRLTVTAPAPQATVDPSDLHFTWRPIGDGAAYRITLADEGGDPLWTAETSDTFLPLPTDVALDRGETYLWYVDAVLVDGRTGTTGVQRFDTAR